MRVRHLALLAGPALYALLALGLDGRLPTLLVACAVFSAIAVAALAIGSRAELPMNASALLGLAGLAGAALLPAGPAPHAALVLLCALGLGAAFAKWVAPRLPDLSVVLTTAVCLALFDLWSVKFGPARKAAEGGLLKRLLLDVPAPDGWVRFLGVSDLVVIALLAGVCAARGAPRWRAFAAGLLGIWACLAQAYLTRGPAPALPWIGGFFALLAWPMLRPDRSGWIRTARWAGFTAVALGVLTAARMAIG